MENTINENHTKGQTLCVNLSPHFTMSEFCNWQKYPQNIPTIQQIANMTYGCRLLLEPAREAIGWLHISWAPFSPPRHYVRIGYYK